MKIRSFLISFLAAGILSAQPAARHQGAPGRQLQRLTQNLNLTADQQAQARTILQNSFQQNRPLATQRRDARQAMTAAVKSGNEQQIDQAAQQSAQLRTQMAAARAKTAAKLYAILTPDQKAKVGENVNSMLGHPMARKKAAAQ
jgi:Spy/CpxP family protein refolding chaperone